MYAIRSYYAHHPDTAGTGIGAESTGDTFIVIGDILIAHPIGTRHDLTAINGTGRADGLTEMTVTAGTTAQTAGRLLILGDATVGDRIIMAQRNNFV